MRLDTCVLPTSVLSAPRNAMRAGYCDGELVSGLISLLCAPIMLCMSYVRNAYLVISTYEHNGSGGPVPDGYCRFPASGSLRSSHHDASPK